MDYRALAEKYGTPLYLYDFDKIKQDFLALKNSFKPAKSLMSYAVKANSNLSVLKLIASLDGGGDCVSLNEIKRCLKAGIPSYKIIFSGVGKRDEEIKEAIKLNILFINIESFEELKRVELIAKEMQVRVRISVRVNPNIDAKTHAYISTGMYENKFGVDIDEAYKIYFFSKKSEWIDPTGIHFHIGSQLTELQPLVDACAIIAQMVKKLQMMEIDLSFVDVGGGIGIDYDGETLIDVSEYASEIKKQLSAFDITIITEMGRYVVGNAGVFLSKVLYEKENAQKRFVIIDGAMNDLIRPSLYGATHQVELISDTAKEHESKPVADIVGPVCESGDFLAKNVTIAQTAHNDLLLVKSAGAYCFALSSNYNSRTRCAEVALQEGKDRLIRERENFDDLIAKEAQYL